MRKRTSEDSSGSQTVRRHPSFCSQARRHRPTPPEGSSPLRSSCLGHTAIYPRFTRPSRPSSTQLLRTRRIFPLPQPLSLFPFSLLILLQFLFFRLSFLIMTSLVVSTSSVSSLHSASSLSFHTASSPPSPKPLATSSACSSQVSFSQADEG